MVTVLIPWRPQASRIQAFDAVRDWYRQNVPDSEIRTVDSPDEIFNLSQCRNLGIASIETQDEVVVINDADTLPDADALAVAIEQAAHSGLVHLPYTEYHWLGPDGSAQFYDGVALDNCEFELVRGACSGVYVTTPRTWWSHGGQDERFRGWGFEDAAWYLAHETLLGEPPRRNTGAVYALNHETQPREGEQYDLNAELMATYRAASADTDAMGQIVFWERTAR